MGNKLIVLWVTRDIEAALHMAFMYARNSKVRGWWDEVDLVIWGPSQEVAANNEIIQEELKVMQHVGVKVKACIACADRYGVAEKLRSLNIEVVSMGPILSEELQNGVKVITI
ncbi:MAG: DsrE family protein [Sedimentibacter sp.]